MLNGACFETTAAARSRRNEGSGEKRVPKDERQPAQPYERVRQARDIFVL